MLCFKDLANYLANEKWNTKSKINTADESKRIIQTAAKIILNDTSTQNYETDFLTTATIENIEEGESYIPQTLKQFLSTLVKNNWLMYLLDKLQSVMLGQDHQYCRFHLH